jgi:hypothetical protein
MSQGASGGGGAQFLAVRPNEQRRHLAEQIGLRTFMIASLIVFEPMNALRTIINASWRPSVPDVELQVLRGHFYVLEIHVEIVQG